MSTPTNPEFRSIRKPKDNNSQINDSSSYQDERDSYEDNRRFQFFMLDNDFVDASFDVYTSAYYMRVVRRAHNSSRGFDEFQRTTSKAMDISKTKIKECIALLEFCNIIKVQPQVDPANPHHRTKNRITLVDRSAWNLKHEYRDAGDFAKATRVPMAEELKEKRKKTLLNKKKSKEVNSDQTIDRGVGRHTTGGGSPHDQGWVATRPVIKNTPLKNTPLKNTVCDISKSYDITHIKIKNSEEDKKEFNLKKVEIISNKKFKKILIKNNKEIPINFQWKLSEALKPIFKLKFIDNADCEDIIEQVLKATNCTLKDFRKVIADFSKYDSNIIFSKNKFDIESITCDLIKWINQKEHILVELQKQKEIELQNKLKQEILFKEQEKSNENIKKNEEKLKQEIIKARNEMDEKEFEKLPENFKEWFQELNLFTKKELKKQLKTYGINKFIDNIIPAIQSFQTYLKNKNNPMINQLTPFNLASN